MAFFCRDNGRLGLPVLGTQRLALRPWTLEDIDALHALWTTPEVRRYLWDDTVITGDVAERLVDSQMATAVRDGIGYWRSRTLSYLVRRRPNWGLLWVSVYR